jgi:transposase
MHSLSQTQKNTILSMLDAGHSAHSIASITGVHASTISRLCSKEHSELQKSTGGHPAKLSPYTVTFTIMFISSLFMRQKMVFKSQGNPIV